MENVLRELTNEKNVFVLGIVIALIVAFIISKKLLYNKEDKEGSSLKIILCLFIILMIGLASYIIIFGKKISDANILSAIISFTSPFIAFSGAYAIFEFGKRKEDANKIIVAKEQEDYSKDMLYSMLVFTIKETEFIVELIFNRILIRQSVDTSIPIKDLMGSTPEIEDKRIRDYLRNELSDDKGMIKELNEYIISKNTKNLVYDNDWTKYMKYINKKERINIVRWINMLKSDEVNAPIFITLRNIIAIELTLHPEYIEDTSDIEDSIKITEKIMKRHKS